jgi:hypothetical protein
MKMDVCGKDNDFFRDRLAQEAVSVRETAYSGFMSMFESQCLWLCHFLQQTMLGLGFGEGEKCLHCIK